MNDLQLELPTGVLIAGDAAALFADARPILEGLPTGCFPAAARDGGLEVRLTEPEPVAWTEVAVLATPSGYAALLDAAALADYTDLGDEPVDEFELLSERFEDADVARFQGVLAVRGVSGRATLRLGRDVSGAISRITLRFSG
ncbi:hypothetical protein [Actinospica sp.]|uniref:hypothetical protein n=1 Tax=Actinospica sp. TaxID=1872142 RepID=UPI002C926BDF|nr:hypothetical protein [Actinospica sp.]HWG23149.1 hypothetical protein [Actinospica sp.]